METIIVNDALFHYLSIVVYIVTGISCAYIKWGHVCLPYKGLEHIHYPNRRKWILTFALSVLLIGCIINPQNEDNWVASRCFMILITPNFMINGIRKQCNNTHKLGKGFIAAEIPVMTIAILLVLAGWLNTGILAENKGIVLNAVALIGFAYTIGIILTLIWLKQQIKIYYENKYSNIEEFPTSFARKLTIMVGLMIPVIWTNFLSHNHILSGISFITIAIAHIYFLNYMLDSHIKIKKTALVNSVEQNYNEDINMGFSEESEEETDAEPNEALLTSLKELMDKDKPFLNTNLTIMELAKALNTSVPTLRSTCKANFGSFIKMVNNYRLDYAKKLRLEHPEYSKQAIAEDSGFGSYRSLLRAEKNDA